jgi:hypothetical protein
MPVSAWLLLRLGEDPTATPDAIAREHGIPRARKDEGISELKACGYLVATNGMPSSFAITPAGCAAYDRLAQARRERLRELSAQSLENQRQLLPLRLGPSRVRSFRPGSHERLPPIGDDEWSTVAEE